MQPSRKESHLTYSQTAEHPSRLRSSTNMTAKTNRTKWISRLSFNSIMKERAGALTEVGAPAFSFLQLNRCIRENGTKQVKNSFSVPRVWKRMVLDKIKNGFPFQVAIIAWYWTSQKRSPVPSGHHNMVLDKSKTAFQFQVTAGHGTKQVKSHLWGHTAGRNNETEPGKQKIPF